MAFERERVNVFIKTANTIIKGEIHIPVGGRMTDFINIPSKDFIPVTNAEIDLQNGKIIHTSLMQLNKDYIVFIVPLDSIEE